MKSLFLIILFCLSSIFCINIKSTAQTLPKSTIGSVYKSSEAVEFSVAATEPFYVGGNVFILHIGDSSFDLYRQTDIDGKGNLDFIIPINQFYLLKESTPIFLTYGKVFNDGASAEEKQTVAQTVPELCQYLGQFSFEILNK